MRMISVCALMTLVLCLLFGVPYLEFMKKKMYGQYIREEVQKLHAKKNKTPTTGGVFLIMALLVGSLIALFMAQAISTRAIIVLMTLVFYTFTGFEDDIKKIKGCQNEGLSPRAKLALQIAVSMLPAVYLVYQGQTDISIFNFHINLFYLYPETDILYHLHVRHPIKVSLHLSNVLYSLPSVCHKETKLKNMGLKQQLALTEHVVLFL